MAKVSMLEPGTPIPGVYSVENLVEYMVCDVCRSYSIEEKPQVISLFWKSAKFIIRIAAVIAVMGAAIFIKDWLITILIGMACFILFILTVPQTYLKCRKCGNEKISDADIEPAPLKDVTDELTTKKYIRSYIG